MTTKGSAFEKKKTRDILSTPRSWGTLEQSARGIELSLAFESFKNSYTNEFSRCGGAIRARSKLRQSFSCWFV